ncbi:thioesterase [Luteibacter rhizovicinus DSM 16549]|jgi:acyl-CoA thioester hydrolase|uniref:Thioesterase n=1 Tax=Luteibacter rhizovicinus DSM 16549 TaxID=1440763 RepID=A0A0G9HF41_9GAMM|nr:thioesterase family protein [Luteibacter rhizovicinus]APG02655.1 thioesterase [Luteibacter rhizovicinus DSM 16549]KLD68313.1 thioesterase [Luteibacter rhizovicinus DSM 16549]KLD74470.1 thioesterase [Xanthomonas hyacinthi DSM 19077]
MRANGVFAVDTELTVPFFDVDSMEVVWHGHYVKYLEIARCALLDALGHGYVRMKDTGYAWPIIDLQLRYARAARFGQALVVRAELVEWQNRLKIHYTLSDAASGERLTRASTIQVAVKLADGEMQLVSPSVFIDDIERHLARHSSP